MLAYITAFAANLFLWLWLSAALGAWFLAQKTRRRVWAVVPWILIWVLACRPVSEAFLRPLENRFTQPSVSDLRDRGIAQVVVLTSGGFEPTSELTSSTLTTGSAARLLGGVELCALLGPDCSLILSGSAGRGRRGLAAAEHMRALVERLAPDMTTQAETQSGSTTEHPANVTPLLADGPFVLVTSAYHMPRAMGSFQRAGLAAPIAFPVDHQVRGDYGWQDAIPSFSSLRLLELAWREYLARTLYFLRGW